MKKLLKSLLFPALFLICLLLLIWGGLTLKKSRQSVIDIDITEGVKRIELENGAIVLLKKIPGSGVSSVQTFIRTGSVNEGEYLGYGLSHCLEHMLFKGSKNYPRLGELSETIKNAGGQFNAYTSYDRTVWHVTLPSENTPVGMSVMIDAILHSLFKPEELAKEIQVIKREIAMGLDDPDRRLWYLMAKKVYRVHPYKYPVIGYIDLLSSVTVRDVRKYHQERYRPRNLIFVCVGDFDEQEIMSIIQKKFSVYQEYPSSDLPVRAEPDQNTFRFAQESMPDLEMTRIAAAYRTVDLQDEDAFALDVLAIMAGQGKSSILNMIMKEKTGLVYSVGAFSWTPQDQGLFEVDASCRDEDFTAVTNKLLSVLSSLSRYLNHAGLKRAKRKVLSDYIYGLQTVQGQARELGMNEMLTGDINYSSKYIRGINSVTLSDLQKVLHKYFRRDHLTLVAVRPETPVQTNQTAKQQTTDSVLNVDKKILPNGLTVLFIDRPGLPLVNLKLIMKGGLLLDRIPGIGNFTVQAAVKGSRKYPGLSGVQKLEELGGSLTQYSGNNSAGFTVYILEPDLKAGLDVLFQTAQNAVFKPSQIEFVRDEILQEISAQNEEIFYEGSELLRQNLYGDHPYAQTRLGSITSISSISRNDLKSFYEDWWVAENSLLTVSGDLNEQQKKSILRLFSSYRSSKEQLVLPAPPVISESSDKIVVERNKAQSLLLLAWPIPSITNQDRYASEVMSSVLSGMGGRLFLELRDRNNLGYYVGAYNAFFLQQGYFLDYIGVASDGLNKAEQLMFREMNRIKTELVSPSELQRAKNDLIGEYKVNEQSYDSLALSLGLFQLYYGDHSLYFEYLDRIEQVTSPQILDLARRTFSNKFTEVQIRGVNHE